MKSTLAVLHSFWIQFWQFAQSLVLAEQPSYTPCTGWVPGNFSRWTNSTLFQAEPEVGAYCASYHSLFCNFIIKIHCHNKIHCQTNTKSLFASWKPEELYNHFTFMNSQSLQDICELSMLRLNICYPQSVGFKFSHHLDSWEVFHNSVLQKEIFERASVRSKCRSVQISAILLYDLSYSISYHFGTIFTYRFLTEKTPRGYHM